MGWFDQLLGRDAPQRSGQALTAAAKIITLDDEHERQRIRRGALDWQRQAFHNFDTLPEICNATIMHTSAMSRLNIVPAVRPDPRSAPVPLSPEGEKVDGVKDVPDEIRAAMHATVDRLVSGPMPGKEILRLLDWNMFLAGDCYLLGYNDPEYGGEVWDVCSVEEFVISQNGKGYARRRADESGPIVTEDLPPDTWAIRVFTRHGRYSTWAWSAMRSVLETCEELELLGHAIRAAASSRLSAPLWLIPHGMRGQGPLDQTMVGNIDEAQQDPFIQSITQHYEAPKRNPRSAAGVVPGMIFAEREDIQAFKDILPLRDIDHEASAQRIECISRIATGLDMPTEALTGKVDLNHWTAWQVDEETFKYHLEPGAQALMGSLTVGYFRPHLAKMGITDVDRYFMWYDATDLVAHPNQEKNYVEGFDRFAVSFSALRRELGIAEEDAPNDQEIAFRTYLEIMQHFRPKGEVPTPEQILSGEIPILNEAPGATSSGQEPVPGPGPPSPDQTVTGPPASGPPAAAGSGGNDTSVVPPGVSRQAVERPVLPPLRALTASSGLQPAGVRLASIERQLRLRLWQACDDQMSRSLERAGNRLRSLSNRGGPTVRALVADVPKDRPELVGKILGADRVEQLGTSTADLLAGAFDPLRSKWDAWVARAQAQGLATLDEHAPDGLDDVDALELKAQQTIDRDAGWAILAGGLTALAATLVYDPSTSAPARGEWSDVTVPPGLIRDALTTAGGGPTDAGGTGLLGAQTISDALASVGLSTTAYVWEAGDPDRPFEPHQNLDGVTFTSPTDDQLTADEDWVDAGSVGGADGFYWPGDHAGCLCNAVADIGVPQSPEDVQAAMDAQGIGSAGQDVPVEDTSGAG